MGCGTKSDNSWGTVSKQKSQEGKCVENNIHETFKTTSELVKIWGFYVFHIVNILAFNISTSTDT